MGGTGSGGARLNSGPDRTVGSVRWRREHKKKAAAPVVRVLGCAGTVERPRDLPADQVAVWERWAPMAMAQRTLVPETVGDFRALCELETERASVLAARQAEGWTDVGLRLAAAYRGLVQRIESKARAFRLAPIGKEMMPATAPVDDPWSRFDGPAN